MKIIIGHFKIKKLFSYSKSTFLKYKHVLLPIVSVYVFIGESYINLFIINLVAICANSFFPDC